MWKKMTGKLQVKIGYEKTDPRGKEKDLQLKLEDGKQEEIEHLQRS
jgi:hypothetical protein